MNKDIDVLIEIEKKEGIITSAIYSSSFWEQRQGKLSHVSIAGMIIK